MVSARRLLTGAPRFCLQASKRVNNPLQVGNLPYSALLSSNFMSSSAAGLAGHRATRFWSTANGKKAVMAVSGVVLVGFLLGHLAGNLQIFLGPETFNGYARMLRELPA